MNYLAHAVLSGKDYHILAGNLLADRIKGPLPEDVSPGVRCGVQLHRHLDAFTDNHPVFRRSRRKLSADFRHYSAVVVDVVYDHFLACHINTFTGMTLDEFIHWADEGFAVCAPLLPERLRPRWTNLLWLGEYVEESGIDQAFRRIMSRSRRTVDFGGVLDRIRPILPQLEDDFLEFFPEAIVACESFLSSYGHQD